MPISTVGSSKMFTKAVECSIATELQPILQTLQLCHYSSTHSLGTLQVIVTLS